MSSLLTEPKRPDEMTYRELEAFIETLELPEGEKQRLRELTPGNYIGVAEALAKRI